MNAKKFFYTGAGILLLVIALSVGAVRTNAQGNGMNSPTGSPLGEITLDHAAITLTTSGHAWSPGTGLITGVERTLQIPIGVAINRFEIELMRFSSNYPPCVIRLTLPGYPIPWVNGATFYFGNCSSSRPVAGMVVVVSPGDWGFGHLVGLTSQGSRTQEVEASASFDAPGGVLLQFEGVLDLRAVGEPPPVPVTAQAWSLVRQLYR